MFTSHRLKRFTEKLRRELKRQRPGGWTSGEDEPEEKRRREEVPKRKSFNVFSLPEEELLVDVPRVMPQVDAFVSSPSPQPPKNGSPMDVPRVVPGVMPQVDAFVNSPSQEPPKNDPPIEIEQAVAPPPKHDSPMDFEHAVAPPPKHDSPMDFEHAVAPPPSEETEPEPVAAIPFNPFVGLPPLQTAPASNTFSQDLSASGGGGGRRVIATARRRRLNK